MNKKCIKNKKEVFFYLSVTANLSSGGMDFLILVTWNLRLEPSKTSSSSKVVPDILKCLKTFLDASSGTGIRIFL